MSTVSAIRRRVTAPLLAVGVFAVGTEGLVFAGLLPDLARDLGVSVGAAGQVTTAFGLSYALAAPVLAVVVESWRPRATLATGFALFTVGNVLTATAHSLGLLLCWRVLTAAGASLVTPTSTTVAAALADPRRRARAISVVVSGLTLASAAGAPLGTLVGGRHGWRAAIWAITALGVLVAGAVLLGVPDLAGRPRRGLRARLRPLRVPTVRRLLATTLTGFLAVYVVYVYASVVWTPSGAEPGFLAAVLAVIGAAGISGNLAAGALTDRYGGRRVVTGVLLVLAAAIAANGVATVHRGVALTGAAAYGLAAWAVTGPQQHRLIAADPDRTGLPVALNSSALYLAVAAAGALGGALAAGGRRPVLVTGAGVALVAAWLSHRAEDTRRPPAPGR